MGEHQSWRICISSQDGIGVLCPNDANRIFHKSDFSVPGLLLLQCHTDAILVAWQALYLHFSPSQGCEGLKGGSLPAVLGGSGDLMGVIKVQECVYNNMRNEGIVPTQLQIYFSESTDANASLIQKHPHKHIHK